MKTNEYISHAEFATIKEVIEVASEETSNGAIDDLPLS